MSGLLRQIIHISDSKCDTGGVQVICHGSALVFEFLYLESVCCNTCCSVLQCVAVLCNVCGSVMQWDTR